MPVRRCAPEVEKAGTRREHPHAAALGAWVSLDDLIALVAEAYGTEPQPDNQGRQVLLYLACTWCRGPHSLTDLAEQLGPISVGGLTHARDVMAALGRDPRPAAAGRPPGERACRAEGR